jgi:serine/threonine protein kinase
MEYFKQLLVAFRVLSKHNIMHRDLKPDNILFHNEVLKLGDFGFCKNLKEDSDMTATMLGSPIYMAPEVLKGDSYTTKADIWSLGVVLFEMLYGFCPFETGSIAQLIAKVTTSCVQFPVGVQVSESTQNLIRRMVEKDPVRRIDWPTLFSLVGVEAAESPNKHSSCLVSSSSSNRLQQSIENIPPSWQNKSELKRHMPGTGSSSAIKLLYPATTDNQSFSYDVLPRRLNLTPDSKLASTNPTSTASKPLPLSDRRKLFLAEHRFCTNGIRTASEFAKNDDTDSLVFCYLLLKKS